MEIVVVVFLVVCCCFGGCFFNCFFFVSILDFSGIGDEGLVVGGVGIIGCWEVFGNLGIGVRVLEMINMFWVLVGLGVEILYLFSKFCIFVWLFKNWSVSVGFVGGGCCIKLGVIIFIFDNIEGVFSVFKFGKLVGCEILLL